MKKTLLILLAVMMSVTLFSCQIPFLNFGAPDGEGNNGGDEPAPTPPSEYTVTFDTDAGYDIDSAVVKPGELCKKPYDPVKRGYKFSAWYYEDIKWNFNTDKVNDNITLKAKYTPVSYTITYDRAGGTPTETLPTTYTVESETIVFPALTKEDCTFAGWYSNGKLITEIPAGSTGNFSLVADFYGPDATVKDSETASVRTWNNGTDITVKLTDKSDEPLTVSIDFPKPWHTVKVLQGKTVKYVETYMDGDKRILDIEMIPNSDNAVITPVILEGDTLLPSQFGVQLSNGMKIDKNYYPGFVRKSVTFTIDDGDLKLDPKFISIVKPAGIVGTFNLCRTSGAEAITYLNLYKGFEVANHMNIHSLPTSDKYDFSSLNFKDEVFNSSTSDTSYVYKSKDTPGLYYIDYSYYSSGTPNTSAGHKPYWHPVATYEAYTKDVDATKADIESVFGEGSVVGYVYPHGIFNESIKQYLKESGYLYARATAASGLARPVNDFSLPKDRYCWIYNANASDLNEVMAKYDALADDGTLKFFSFGVHAVDFDGKWYVLESFAKKYGNRPEDFWYASNRDIFEYEDAVNALEIYEDKIVNPSNIDVFVTINNVKTIIHANSVYEL